MALGRGEEESYKAYKSPSQTLCQGKRLQDKKIFLLPLALRERGLGGKGT
jgi:hypothetical protein